MKCVIRPNIWESNSSMSHQLIILPEDLAKKWENEEDTYCYYDKVLTLDELKKALVKDGFYGYINSVEDVTDDVITDLRWDGICTYGDWESDDGEITSETYTTKSGDKIVIYLKYGYYG